MLTLAGLVAMAQRCQDAVDRVQAGDDVDERHADFRRVTRLRPGHRHEPAHGLHEQVVAGQVLAVTGAEAADRAHDRARVGGSEFVVPQAHAFERAGLEVLDHHVGAERECLRLGATLGGREIEPARGLVAVDRREVRRLAVRSVGRSPVARVVTGAGSLDLHDLGPEVTEQHRGVRTREHSGEVRDDDAVEGARAHPR